MSPPKPRPELVTTVISEFFALYLTYHVYLDSGTGTALLVGISTVWLAYKVSTFERIWNTMGMLINPAKSLLVTTSVALVYFGLQGFSLHKLLITGIGFTFIGAALAFVAYGYWNIG